MRGLNAAQGRVEGLRGLKFFWRQTNLATLRPVQRNLCYHLLQRINDYFWMLQLNVVAATLRDHKS
jgi:hypothetical protein